MKYATVICLFFLVGCAAPALQTPAEQPTPLSTPVTGNWITETGQSEFDDSKTVIIYLEADKAIKDWLNNEITPVLYIRCQEKALKPYIYTGTPPDKIDSYGYAKTRVRFDQESADETYAKPSTDGDSLFFSDGKTFIITLLKHDTLLFGFTPYGTDPVSFTFTLTGLKEAIKPVLEVCPYITP